MRRLGEILFTSRHCYCSQTPTLPIIQASSYFYLKWDLDYYLIVGIV